MIKRAIDITGAALGLVLLSPLLLITAIAIKLDSPGPVMFRQVRVGRHGQEFRIFKFRTMSQVQPAGGPQVTADGDARITRIGAYLRRWKLDELPQLVDVLRGTMSLVGPRPEVPRYVAMYTPTQREQVLGVRPGLTDFASLRYRHESEMLARAVDPEREYVEVILPDKLRVAASAVEHATIATDLRALGLTLRLVVPRPAPLRKVHRMLSNTRFWTAVEFRMQVGAGSHRVAAVLIDAAVVLVSWHVTYLFRLGFERWQPGRPWYDDWVSLGVVAAYLLFLWLAGARDALWRYFAFDDFRRLAVACVLAGMVSAVAVLMAQLVGVARAVLVLHPLFTLFGLTLVRMLWRMLWEHAHALASGDDGERRYAIVLGAGETARRLISGMHGRHGWTMLMLLDDDPALHGLRIAGVPVRGGIDRMRDPAVIAQATHVIVALADEALPQRDRAMRMASESGLVVLTVPSSGDLNVAEAPV